MRTYEEYKEILELWEMGTPKKTIGLYLGIPRATVRDCIQHSGGLKHERAIVLAQWQQYIVDAFPLEFFRGLYHSDGSRSRNIVIDKDYPRYSLTNTSEDIARLFCDTCDRLGIHWTPKYHTSKHGYAVSNIFISRRKDVEYLDRAVGPKA